VWASNRQKTAKTKIFTYFWTHALPGPDSGRYGAFHTSEVPYVFNSLNRSGRPFTAAGRKAADTMSSYWANFAKNGDPNGNGLARWSAFEENAKSTMELGENWTPRPVTAPGKLEFWQRHFSKPKPLE
jgi:para-nitrobenzyl esterase